MFDVNRPDRTVRRRRGKSDPLDAQNATRAVLSGRARAQAKTGDGPVQIARMFKLAKGSAVKARTQAINQLKAVLVTADPALEELAGLNNPALIRTCARLADTDEDGGGGDAVLQATRITLCLLARRIEQLTGQIQDLERRLALLVEHHSPHLLAPVGLGPDTAVTLLITMGAIRSAWAARRPSPRCAGVSPVERSLGSRQYRRLNRGGRPCRQGETGGVVFALVDVEAEEHGGVTAVDHFTPPTRVGSPRPRRGTSSRQPRDEERCQRTGALGPGFCVRGGA
ncbi:hypothetical protein [Streptomyces nigrescens]|uniref:hypothetical protein n=1 Tax=Streptomyces nigrescens TaxID=1920 RepID=UPI0034994095